VSTPTSADQSKKLNEADGKMEPATLPKAKTRWRTLLSQLLQAFFGAVFGFVAITVLIRSGMQLAPIGTNKISILLCLLLSAVLAFPIQLIAHELGHALAGRMMGGYLLRFVIGPWRGSRFRSGFRWRRVRALQGIGGFVQTLMPADGRFQQAMIAMLLGGPLANLLLAALSLVVIFYLPYWPFQIFASAIVLFGLLLGVVNLIPFRVAGFLTDGAQLLQLWTKPDALASALRTARIARASIDGLRPRELNDLDVAAFDPDQVTGMERFVALLVRASVAADRGLTAEARVFLERAVAEWDTWPDGFRQLLAISQATMSAEVDGDSVSARAWLAKAEGGLVEDFQLAWIEALIAQLEGRLSDRDRHLDELRRCLADTVYLGDARVYHEKLGALTSSRVSYSKAT